MRILKNRPNLVSMIVGEMINVEMSLLHFIDGEPTSFGAAGGPKVDTDYRGYPKIVEKFGVDGDPKQRTVTYDIKASSGYIYIPVGYNIDLLEQQLIAAIDGMASTVVRLDGRVSGNLKEYHTIQSGYNTNVKIRSAQNNTLSSERKVAPRRAKGDVGATNTKRQFCREVDDIRRGRFTWFIIPIDKFDDLISADNIEDAISRLATSIFFDADDICKLDHNSTVFDFSKKMLKGYDSIVNESIVLFKHAANPLLFELNEHWRNSNPSPSATTFLRNIEPTRVYSIEYEKLIIKPVKLNDSGTESSIDVCSKCRCPLYDENYALAGSAADPGQNLCVAICPLCSACIKFVGRC